MRTALSSAFTCLCYPMPLRYPDFTLSCRCFRLLLHQNFAMPLLCVLCASRRTEPLTCCAKLSNAYANAILHFACAPHVLTKLRLCNSMPCCALLSLCFTVRRTAPPRSATAPSPTLIHPPLCHRVPRVCVQCLAGALPVVSSLCPCCASYGSALA